MTNNYGFSDMKDKTETRMVSVKDRHKLDKRINQKLDDLVNNGEYGLWDIETESYTNDFGNVRHYALITIVKRVKDGS